MSDPTREEQAFRDALRSQAEAEPFAPLDPALFSQARRHQPRRWQTLAMAASVLVVAGVMVPALMPGLTGNSPAPGPRTAVVEQAGTRAEPAGGANPEQAPASDTKAGGLPSPAAGFRWESYRDVVVQVPQTWGYALDPGAGWCAPAEVPDAPYVDTGRGLEAVPATRCAGPLPSGRQELHLSFATAAAARSAELAGGWQSYARTVGDVLVSVVARTGDAELARAILDSARTVTGGVDHNGCAVQRPAVVAAPLAGLLSKTVTVCLYDNAEQALVASTTLTGSAAVAAWEAMLGAPQGGGPDGTAAECRAGDAGPVTIVLGFGDGSQAVLRIAGCTGNGLTDSGADKGLRRITPELCRALIVPPVAFFSGVGPAASLCLGATRVP